MFRAARMQKLSIVTLNQYTKPIVDVLHEEGVLQIDDLSEKISEDEEFKELSVSKQDPNASRIASLSMKCGSLIDTLESAEQSEGMVELIRRMINPTEIKSEEVEDLDSEELSAKAEEIINEVDANLSPIESRINEIGTEETKYKDALNISDQLSSFNVDLADLQNTKYTCVLAGRLPSEQLSEARSQIGDVTDQVDIFEGQSNSDDDAVTVPIILVSGSEFEEEISGILRRLEFERFNITGLSGTPSELHKTSEEKLDECKKERDQCYKDIREVGQRSKKNLLVLNEQLELEKERTEIYAYFGETETTKTIKAWVVKDNVDETLSTIERISEGNYIVDIEDPTEEEIRENKVPVKQKNPGFARPYELLVNMYSTPNYGDIDPTIIMALCFPFFFGFLLTDAFYGILITIIGLIMYRGIGKVSRTYKSFSVILTQMGLWTILLGLITGGFLGDFIPRFIMGDANAMLPTVIPDINAFSHPENILIVALAIGIIHLNIAYIFGIIDNYKKGATKEMLSGQLCWVLIEVAVVALLIGGMIPAIIIGVIAIIMLLYGAGPMGIMDIFSFIGDILSYSRLLALCLSTGGIALTANLLGQLLASMVPYVGIIIGVIVFLGLHTFNIAFQSMGGFIHALRLHYVEFFGNFYVGASQPFEPFKATRTYTKLRK